MFTLIKREIYDHIAYYIGAIVFSLLAMIIMLFMARIMNDINEMILAPVAASMPVVLIFILGSTAMGVSQMRMDKNKKISAFLSTLAVTRDKILWAKIISGILAILLFFIPLLFMAAFLYKFFFPPVTILQSIFFNVYKVIFLISLSCYCIGLQTGWNSSRLIPTLGGLFLTCIFLTIIFVKGFSEELSVLLILFIIASLVRIRYRFISTSL